MIELGFNQGGFAVVHVGQAVSWLNDYLPQGVMAYTNKKMPKNVIWIKPEDHAGWVATLRIKGVRWILAGVSSNMDEIDRDSLAVIHVFCDNQDKLFGGGTFNVAECINIELGEVNPGGK